MKLVPGIIPAVCIALSAMPGLSRAAIESHAGSMTQGATITVDLSNGAKRGADPAVFDSFTSAGALTTTTGVPRTFIGGVFSIDGAGPQVDVSRITIFMASTAAATNDNVRANVQLWDTYASAGTPVFSSPASGLISVDLGTQTLAATRIPRSTSPCPVRSASPA